jgi:hypothetical protein
LALLVLLPLGAHLVYRGVTLGIGWVADRDPCAAFAAGVTGSKPPINCGTVGLRGAPTGEERWVTSIHSSPEWSVFPCKNSLMTTVCGKDKDYDDPGLLPPIISVGDRISYTNSSGEHKEFVVRHISILTYDKDVDYTFDGRRFIARKGDSTCILYDAKSRSATLDTRNPSKVVVRGCRPLR